MIYRHNNYADYNKHLDRRGRSPIIIPQVVLDIIRTKEWNR